MQTADALPQLAEQPAFEIAVSASQLSSFRLIRANSQAATERVRTLVATCAEQLEAAAELVRRRYSGRGYCVDGIPEAEAAPRVTLLAQKDEQLLGTLTVRPGPRGLLAEQAYAAEIRGMRRAGLRVGELTKLALEERCDWKAALDALVQSAYLVTRFMHALSHVVIEVNPRHARFYDQGLGFVLAAGERFCDRVGAPSVLMQLDLEQFGKRLRPAVVPGAQKSYLAST